MIIPDLTPVLRGLLVVAAIALVISAATGAMLLYTDRRKRPWHN